MLHVDLHCITISIFVFILVLQSVSMSVYIWILQSVESLHIPCKLTFSIYIHIYIHMDIIECVHTLYLHSCLYQCGYYRMWSVSTLHVE